MSNWIGPTVKQLWNYAMHVLYKFFGFNINTTAFCLCWSSLHLLLLKSSAGWILLRFLCRQFGYNVSLVVLAWCIFNFCLFGFFSKKGQPRPLFHLFSVLSNKHYKFLQQIYVKQCPSSIRCRDSNPRPSEHESPSITTRPGLPPNFCLFVGVGFVEVHLAWCI